jgi:hypothetical protein
VTLSARSAETRRVGLDGTGGWLLVVVVAAYVVGSTWWRVVPIGPGLPFVACWAGLFAVGIGSVALYMRRMERRLLPLHVLAVLAATAIAVTDGALLYQPLRDLGIYLKAGHHFLDGTAVYLQTPLQTRPADLTDYPFLYPPFTLPLFAVLATLPDVLARAVWVAGSLLLGTAALRLMGLRWRWVCLALLWPPMFQGLWVGNVAVMALILFALAPRFGAVLPAAAVFKSYTGIAALWLARERRWLDLVAGVGVLAIVAVATLPLTGFDTWRAWLDGLGAYEASQRNLPALYGFGLLGLVPLWLFVCLAAAAILAALRASGRAGLARLGTATVVASPSLWNHGMLVTVPSLLSLRIELLWLGIAITAVPDDLGWWGAIALIVASWAMPGLRRSAGAPGSGASSRLDPLVDGATGPWPTVRSERAQASLPT